MSKLLRDSGLNFLGQILGTAISFVAYPILVRKLGIDRFGVSSIAGAVVGYFMVFDLGLGRASVVVLGEALAAKDQKKISGLFWSGQILMFSLGLVGAVVLTLLAPYLCRSVLSIPQPLIGESIWGIGLIAFSIPVMIVFSAHLGLLGNLGKFGSINVIRTLMNVLSWAAPLIALMFRHDLIATFGAMLVARILISGISLGVCTWAEPAIRIPRLASWREISPLLRQGGWMTVTNIVAPLMNSMDRTILGSMAGLTAVTYYSVAGDTSQKLWIIQASIAGALFPTLPGLLHSDRGHAFQACKTAFRLLVLVMVPLSVGVAAVGPYVLVLWIGAKIGVQSALPFSVLLIGVFVNSFAHVPFSLIAASGRSRYAAILHLIETPLFFVLLYVFGQRYGAVGASVAWTIRTVADAIALYWGGSGLLVGLRAAWLKDSIWIGGTAVVISLTCTPLPETIRWSLQGLWVVIWAVSYRGDLISYLQAGKRRLSMS